MRATDNKVIIYDNTCPMCSLYTNAFVKSGLLNENARMPFAALTDEKIISSLDLQRSRHEIPLIDTAGGRTLYGVDSLVYIIGSRYPFVKRLMNIRFVDYFFRKLYKMISYNRRIIIPARAAGKGIDCTPDFNMKYRLAFIVFSLIIASIVTYLFGRSVACYLHLPPDTGGWQILLAAGSGWVLQMTAALLFMKRKRIDYLGHLGVVMILGVLLLVPGIVVSSITGYSHWLVPAISVLLSSTIMLWQQVQRARHIGLSQAWTMLWFFFLQATASGWAYVFYLKIVL